MGESGQRAPEQLSGGSDTPTRLSGEHGSVPTRPPVVAPTASIREGDVLGDRYRVLRRLGKGGMGEVHLAEHIAIGRMVAIKTLHTTRDDQPDLARRFMQEARTASRVRHANIVDITDFGHTDQGAPFFVMEYLEGEDLKTLLRREGALPWPRARDIALQICAALTAAHAQGVVHRDMKPDNVFLVRQPDGGELVKVVDFGIAKSTASDSPQDTTQTGVLLGTPEYMSPEQAQDLPLDARSDVYATGVILYRMLAGRVPFQAKNFMTVLARHIQEPPLPPSQADPTRPIAPAQERVVLTCLAKRPEDRYQSAQALAEALRGADGPPAPAPAGRRRWLVPAAALAALALVIPVGLVLATAGAAPLEPVPAATPDPPAPAAPVPEATPPPEDPDPVPEATPPPEDPDPEILPDPEVLPDPEPAPKTRPRPRPDVPKGAPKDAPDDADITAAAAGLRGALAGCSALGIPGTVVKVDVRVGTDGKVLTAAARKPQQGSTLGTCVEQAARRARFPALKAAADLVLPLKLP